MLGIIQYRKSLIPSALLERPYTTTYGVAARSLVNQGDVHKTAGDSTRRCGCTQDARPGLNLAVARGPLAPATSTTFRHPAFGTTRRSEHDTTGHGAENRRLSHFQPRSTTNNISVVAQLFRR